LLLIFGGEGLWQVGIALDTLLLLAQIGPMLAILIAAADARTRAVAVALFLLVTNMIGQSGGPLVSGILSDMLTPSLGKEAIRYAMLVGTIAAVMAGMFCFAAGRRTDAKLIAEPASH
jgi:hypothetical protein